MHTRTKALTAALFVSMLAPGCAPTGDDARTVEIPNPASEHCASKGGKVEIEKNDNGDQVGMCHLPDGSIVEEWELFRRDNPQQKD